MPAYDAEFFYIYIRVSWLIYTHLESIRRAVCLDIFAGILK